MPVMFFPSFFASLLLLLFVALRCFALRCFALRCIALRCVALCVFYFFGMFSFVMDVADE